MRIKRDTTTLQPQLEMIEDIHIYNGSDMKIFKFIYILIMNIFFTEANQKLNIKLIN